MISTTSNASLRGAILALGLAVAPAWPQAAAADTAVVKVQKNGDLIITDLSVVVAATPREVWDVVSDYDHVSGFLHGLKSSKIVSRDGNVWRVEQKGQTSHAGFTFDFESVRDVTVKPFESLQSHLVSGTLKKHDSLTQLVPEATGTRLTYHAESISGVWVPPLLGTSVVEGEVRQQFQEFEREILKRKAAK